MILARIKELREDNDLRQKQIAKVLHCSQATYSKYENGHRDIPIATLIQLAQFYDVSINYLLGLSNNPKDY